MLVLMQTHASQDEILAVCCRIAEMDFKAHPIPGSMRTAIGITGNRGPAETAALESMAGVSSGSYGLPAATAAGLDRRCAHETRRLRTASGPAPRFRPLE